MSLLWVYYHGYVDIEYWEWTLGLVFLFVMYAWAARQKGMMIERYPEYRHFIYGLFAKVIGGVTFSLIYFYYYKGGDTIGYFYSAVAMSNLAQLNFQDFLSVLFGPNDKEHLSLFNETIGYPYGFVFHESRAFFVVRLISPLVMLTFHSYLVTTLILSMVSYIGIWRCYRTFVSYFPSLTNKLAIAFLYMPSVIFWGSAIMKDTFTLSAAFWWVHCVDEIFYKQRRVLFNSVGLVVSAAFMLMIKPYIFMAILPVTILWLLYFQVSRIRSALVKFILIPASIALMLGASLFVLTKLGGNLDKFSLDRMVETIQSTQGDMVKSEQYGSNYFNVGEIDGTVFGLLSKFPVATNAALFRPYLWESRSVVMVLSALENTWLLGFVILVMIRTQVRFFLRVVLGNPLVLMTFSFSVLFAFFIGISTPNFGALVRFKIPLVPMMVSCLYIATFLNAKRREAKREGRPFDLSAYRKGEPKEEPGAKGAEKKAPVESIFSGWTRTGVAPG